MLLRFFIVLFNRNLGKNVPEEYRDEIYGIHMSPEDAAAFGVHDKQVVSVQAPGARGGLLEEVPVRVDKSFTTEMHIDTDEANGLGIANGSKLPVIV